MKLIAILLSTLGLYSCSTLNIAKKHSESIVGTWSTINEYGEYNNYSETTYFKNGTRCTLIIDYSKGKANVYHLGGKYEINENILILHTDKSDDPYIPVGNKGKDIIVSITDQVLTLRSMDEPESKPYYRYKQLEDRGKIHCKYQS